MSGSGCSVRRSRSAINVASAPCVGTTRTWGSPRRHKAAAGRQRQRRCHFRRSCGGRRGIRMKRMAQGGGMPRSFQILRTNSSLISLCRGMALRLLSSGWCHQEWLPPSLNRVQPCWLRWRNTSRRLKGPAPAPRSSCRLQRGRQRGSSPGLPAALLLARPTALLGWFTGHSRQVPLPPSRSTNRRPASPQRCRCSQAQPRLDQNQI